MSVELKGHILNQRQLDAIVPVMNLLMQGKVKQKGFEDACVKACEAAGCPVGYDTTMPGADKTVAERAQAWILNGRVGMSAKAIYCHMTGNSDKDRWNHPHDPDDLNRCLLLLDLIPEWKERMPEMKSRSLAWAGFSAQWAEISQAFIDEAGLDWCKSKSAPRTSALMEQAIGTYEEPGVFRIRL